MTFPDNVRHLPRRGAPAEEPGTDLELAPEVVEAEIVDEPAQVAVAGPAAGASRWEPAGELRPVVAPWLRDAQEVRSRLRWLLRYASGVGLFQVVRLPLYGARILAASPRGVFRLVAAAGRWVSSAELSAAVKAAGGADARTVLAAEQVREKRAQQKSFLLLLGLLGLAVLVVVAGPFRWLLAVAAVGLLGFVGRRAAEKPIVSAAVDRPKATRLTGPIVLRALNASGLGGRRAKKSEDEDTASGTATLVRDPVREGKGWAVTVDLPYGKSSTDAIGQHKAIASGLDVGAVQLFLDVVPDRERRLGMWVADSDPYAGRPNPSPFAKCPRVNVWDPQRLGLDPRGRVVALPLVFNGFLVGANPRQGKALAIDTRVPTPTGWTTMGALVAGDQVFDEQGQPCRVVEAWPVRRDRPCYEVEFSDGAVVTADAEHLWQVHSRADRVHKRPSKTLTTAELIPSLRVETDDRANYSIENAAALQGPDVPLTVPPYTLGAWLGDGTSVTGVVTSPDPSVIAEMQAEGERVGMVPSTAQHTSPGWRVFGLSVRLRDMGVLGNKHIPLTYLRASEGQRRALLAGLLDTDGYCTRDGYVIFAVTSQRLAEDVRHLVASLGYRARFNRKPARLNGKDYGWQWSVAFSTSDKVFRLPKKAVRQVDRVKPSAFRRHIVDIRPVASVPVRCITVDSPNSLYLITDQCIPTHNTFLVRDLVAPAILDPYCDITVLGAKSSDWEAAEGVCVSYCAGEGDDAMVEYAVAALKRLVGEAQATYDAIRALPAAQRPEGKITPELQRLGFRPHVIILEEAQNIFGHRDEGTKKSQLAKQALYYAVQLAKVGPAAGYILIIATQRPSADVIPTDLRDILSIHVALKVNDRPSSDTILGDYRSARGIESASLINEVHRGVATVVGVDNGRGGDHTRMRGDLLTAEQFGRVCAVGRQRRIDAGTLRGHAAGEPDPIQVQVSLLDDLLAVFPNGEDKAWGETLCERLGAYRQELYGGWRTATLTEALKALGVPQRQVNKRAGDDHQNRRGFALEDIAKAAEAR